MLETLRQRGPDDEGLARFPRCLLGHTRLSIIDLSSGHQPMKDDQQDVVIVFNGEIYNYLQLKKELETRGHRFHTTSDTEVILKAYETFGEDCVTHLDGMFAFAIWDCGRESLFLARDRFGKKPLYYAFDKQGNLLFASEIKTLFSSGRIRGELDYGAMDNYLALRYVLPDRTIYRNVFTLLPGECATFRDGRLSKRVYWRLERRPLKITYDEAKEEVRRLFTEAVRKRLVGDVEVGSFLSGGIDSTLVTAYAQQLSSHPLKTFALRYGDHINELPYAEAASRRIGTDHQTLLAGEDDMESLERSLAYYDEPHAESSDFPQSLLSECASRKVKVALSGDGADEVFMGYPRYWNFNRLPPHARPPDPFVSFIREITIFWPEERRKLWGANGSCVTQFLDPGMLRRESNPIARINSFDLTTHLQGQYIIKIDRMSMMHSLEVRSPLLDYQLAEFAFGLPMEYKRDGNNGGKRMLKELLAEIMPAGFVSRKKQGFGAPLLRWLKSERMAKYVRATISEKACLHEFLEKQEVNRVISRFYVNGDHTYNRKVWSLLCLELWLRTHHGHIAC